MSTAAAEENVGVRRLEQAVRYIPADILASLPPAQRQAIRHALAEMPWQPYPVDIRFTIGLPSFRFFVTVVAGRERRRAARRGTDRLQHPLYTVGNTLFTLLLVLLVLLFSGVGLAVFHTAFGI